MNAIFCTPETTSACILIPAVSTEDNVTKLIISSQNKKPLTMEEVQAFTEIIKNEDYKNVAAAFKWLGQLAKEKEERIGQSHYEAEKLFTTFWSFCEQNPERFFTILNLRIKDQAARWRIVKNILLKSKKRTPVLISRAVTSFVNSPKASYHNREPVYNGMLNVAKECAVVEVFPDFIKFFQKNTAKHHQPSLQSCGLFLEYTQKVTDPENSEGKQQINLAITTLNRAVLTYLETFPEWTSDTKATLPYALRNYLFLYLTASPFQKEKLKFFVKKAGLKLLQKLQPGENASETNPLLADIASLDFEFFKKNCSSEQWMLYMFEQEIQERIIMNSLAS